MNRFKYLKGLKWKRTEEYSINFSVIKNKSTDHVFWIRESPMDHSRIVIKKTPAREFYYEAR
jgi:hypothetical protein